MMYIMMKIVWSRDFSMGNGEFSMWMGMGTMRNREWVMVYGVSGKFQEL